MHYHIKYIYSCLTASDIKIYCTG